MLEKFQFHKGAIKTSISNLQSIVDEEFQFHKGAIKTYKELIELNNYDNFNSIKVRLKQGTDLETDC